jgi:hypothetical protein
VTGSGSGANVSTASVEDKTAEWKLRVTSPAWLERRHLIESEDFVHDSRTGTEEPQEIGSPNKSLAGGTEAALER